MTTTKNVSTLSAANVATLSGAFTRHTHALSTNQSIGDVVRKAFIECGITPLELLPAKHELFSGREGVRQAVIDLIGGSFPKQVTMLAKKKPNDCGNITCYLWSERNVSTRTTVEIGDRSDELKKVGYKTEKEHRSEWLKQPNSRLNDYRNSLANALGVSLKVDKPTEASEGEASEGEAVKVEKDTVKVATTQLTNAINAFQLIDFEGYTTTLNVTNTVKYMQARLVELEASHIEPPH